MARSVNQILLDAIANSQGELILRVLTWTDLAAYQAAPTIPDHTWLTNKFDIFSTTANVTIFTDNDYTVSNFTVFIIERGVTLSGVEHTIKSDLFYVRKYDEYIGYIKLEGSSFPDMKLIFTGDDTYKNVIEAFCTAIGKTASWKLNNTEGQNTWLNYQFLPDGKQVNLNKSERLEALIKQKYTLLCYGRSPNELVFYSLNSTVKKFLYDICWAKEKNTFIAVGTTNTKSRDGNNWSESWGGAYISTGAEKFYKKVIWSNELQLFVASGTVYRGAVTRALISTSPDLVTWTERYEADGVSNGIAWSPTLALFVMAYYYQNKTVTSPNGTDWTEHTVAGNNLSLIWCAELEFFISIHFHTTYKASISTNGIDWTEYAMPAGTWTGIAWSAELSLFVAIGTSISNVATSTDGQTWTLRTIGTSRTLSAITWSTELSMFVAVGYKTLPAIASAIAMTSPNGIDWTEYAMPAGNWTGIAWSAELSLFVAVSHAQTGADIATSSNGSAWTAQDTTTDAKLSYNEGPQSHIIHGNSAIHYLWRDENNTVHTSGDTTLPQWNLGYLENGKIPPPISADPFYKMYIQKAPVRLDITDGDKIDFTPYWIPDPAQTLDAMCIVSEHLDTKKSPAWWQEIKSINIFESTEGGALPSTIERVAAYTPLVTSSFDNNLDETVNNLQAFAERVDDMTELEIITTAPTIAVAGKKFAFDTITSTLYIWTGTAWVSISGGTPATDYFLLLEDGTSSLLLENGSKLILG